MLSKDGTPEYDSFLITMRALTNAPGNLYIDDPDYAMKTINHFLNKFLNQSDKPLFPKCEDDLRPYVAKIYLKSLLVCLKQ